MIKMNIGLSLYLERYELNLETMEIDKKATVKLRAK